LKQIVGEKLSENESARSPLRAMLTIVSNFFLGGGDKSVLWLSYAQQKGK
jgi:hypothetical protein